MSSFAAARAAACAAACAAARGAVFTATARLVAPAAAVAVTIAWPPQRAAAQLVINGNYVNTVALTAGTGQPQTTITINNSQFSQTASASLNAAAGGSVRLNNTNVIGGLITQSGDGRISADGSGNNYLTGVTLAGTFDLATSYGVERVQGGLTFGNGVGSSGGFAVNSNSILAFDGDQTLSGTGTIVLGSTGSNNRINVEGSNVTLTVGPNVTIRGQNGTIGGAAFIGGASTIANNGTITADVAGGTITLIDSPVTNGGTVGAANGGRLAVQTAITNTGAGTLSITNGGMVFLESGSVTGGTIVTSTGGVLRANGSGSNMLRGVTLNGTIDLATSYGVIRASDGLTLTAGSTIDVNSNSILAFDGDQTLGGTGTIVLGSTGSNNRITVEGNGVTLTVGPNVTIRGQNGTIGGASLVGGVSTIVNNGTIAADVAGGIITIEDSPVTNNGTLGAANGGTLVLNSNVTASAGSQISAGAGSLVLQNGVTVSGAINTTGNGSFRASSSGSNYLSAATLDGTLDLASAYGVERVIGGLTLGSGAPGSTGTIDVNSNSILGFQGTQTIGGTGTIVLGSTGSNNRISVEGDGVTLTVGPNVTIRGQNGTIGGASLIGGVSTIVNNGTIAADVAAGTITIEDSPVTNNGTLAARNGGTLVLNSDVTGNVGSRIEVGAGSLVLQNGVTVSGAINTTGNGSFRASSSGSNYLSAATLDGTLDLASAYGVERVIGGLTLGSGAPGSTGTIDVNSNSVLALQGTQTIGGTGTIVLGSTGSNNRVTVEGDGVTATIGSGVTIRGQNGTIGGASLIGGASTIVNNGRIAADVAAGTITIEDSPVTNNGTLAALNGGTLVLGTNVAGGAGSQFQTDASSAIVQNGVTLSGLVNVTGGGSLRATNNGNNYLNAATLGGRLDLATATGVERITGGLTLGSGANAGRIDVNSNSVLALQGTQTIGGTGEIVLGTTGASNRITLEGIGTTTIGPNVTIRGTNGTIGTQVFVGGTQTLVNTGTIASDGGGLVTITQSAITNDGLLRAQNGTLTVQTPLTGTGTLQVDAAGTVNLTGGSSVSQGTLAIGGSGATVNNGTRNITLSTDYTNASAGSGNSFNRRAGITGSGQVLAGGDVVQEISGATVTNGTTNAATLTIGNVRVGGTTYTYTIDNGGTTGPALRGAIQTAVNGGNISDSRLSGSGVTPGLYGPAPVGGSAGPYEVTFTTSTAGAIAPLSGQTVNLRSTYENIADQKLNIVVGSGAGAYVVAQGQLNTPALDFGTVQVGQVVTQNLSFTNSATGPAGFVEDLNVGFGAASGTGASRITGSGAITGLAAGATSGGLTVGVNTATAGTVAGTIAINYTSAGTVNGVSNGLGTLAIGGTTYGVNGTIEAAANVVDQAAPVINTPTIALGNVRLGAASPTGAVSITNQATGNQQAALNATISGTAPVTGSGSISLLAPGATNASSLTVGLNTSTAGAVSGTATVSLVSDASNIGGCAPNCQLTLPSQNVTVTGAVYRLANPSVTPTSVTLAARVGDAAPTRALSITNSSPDAFTEALNASFTGAAPTGFTTSGSVTALAAQGTSTALSVGLNTATAGTYAGTATVGAVSTGVGTTGAPDVDVASTNVALAGRVYAPAVADVTATVDFGIVHVGDLATRGIGVTNVAPIATLNDVLVAAVSGGGPAFSTAGTTGGIAAGTSDNTSLQATLNTSTNGQFSGTAAVALVSRNPDLADRSLGSTNVTLTGQVNDFAQGAFAKTGGAGAFSMTGANAFLLDFGTITTGAGATTANLAVDNVAAGFADLLNGSFLTSGTGFSFFGFDAFSNLAAGARLGGLGITFDTSTLGAFTGSVTLTNFGTNASGYLGALDPITLSVRGTITTGAVSAVPEPSTWTMFGAGLVGVGVLVRRRRRGTPGVTTVVG